MKIHLYPVIQEQIKNTGTILNSLNTINTPTVSNRYIEAENPDLIFNSSESQVEPLLLVVNIKDFIAQNKKIPIENVSIFINSSADQSSYGLQDELDVQKLFKNKTLSTNNFMSINRSFNSTDPRSKEKNSNNQKLYFRILTDVPLAKIEIELFLKNIDKILMEVSINCSIYVMKYLLCKRLLIPEDQQNLIDINTQNQFKNDDIISNLIGNPIEIIGSMRLNNSPINNSSKDLNKDQNLNLFGGSDQSYLSGTNKNFAQKTLKIQLVLKGKRRCSIGIDFSFNILKDINKIDFCDEAPSFREASDGLNIFCYCKNKSCKLYEELFVVNIGIFNFSLFLFSKCKKFTC